MYHSLKLKMSLQKLTLYKNFNFIYTFNFFFYNNMKKEKIKKLHQ